MPYLSLPDLFRGADVLHWIDNTSAGATLIHGYSGKPDSARIANIFHMLNCGLRARIYFEYVESKANVADLPSRREFEFLGSIGSAAVNMRMPLAHEWGASLDYWRDLVVPSAVSRVRTRVPGRKRARGHQTSV